jgi:hypothetical protein
MDTWHYLCTFRNVNSFFDIFPSDLLISSCPVHKPCTLVVNADTHTEGISHWLAIRLSLHSWSAYYFDSYGIVPLVPSIQAFIRRNCTTCDYNKRQMQGLTSDVCGQYAVFSPSTLTGVHPQQFITLFASRANAVRHATVPRGALGQCCRSCI